MSLRVTTTGNGSWLGAPDNIQEYSITEEATPLLGGDESGAVSGGSITVVPNKQTPLLMFDTVSLDDSYSGTTELRVANINIEDSTAATMEVDSRAALLLADRSIPPYQGTLGGWFTMVFAACSITSGFTIAPGIASRTVAYGGYVGPVWDAVKQVCAAQQIELVVIGSVVTVRLPREKTATLDRTTELGRSIGTGSMARNVEVVSYSNEWKTGGLVYPTGGWEPEVRVLQVDAHEELEVELEVDVSVASIVQPTLVAYVQRYHTGSSVYSVSGNDGLPIQPAQWLAEGGKLSVEIGEDYKTLIVKIKGSQNEDLAPFQIAVASGTSDVYSSLRIVGTGVWQIPTTELYPTGADPDLTADEVGETIDLPFAYGRGQVVSLGVSAAQRFTGIEQTLSGSAERLFHAGPEATQAFGNAIGARLETDDNLWRIRTMTVSEADQAFTAEPDNTFADFNARFAGMTFADFNARFAGMSFAEFNLFPLTE